MGGGGKGGWKGGFYLSHGIHFMFLAIFFLVTADLLVVAVW